MVINNNYSPQCRRLVVWIFTEPQNKNNSETIEHKNDDFLMIYCCQLLQFWHVITKWPSHFLAKNKTFEGICLALARKFLQKEL